MIGQTVGKYRVLDRIGRGGMGTVYRALDETLDREVAIKVLNPELNDPEVARRFRAEAVTVARLNHPGIATIYELFQRDDQWLMIMEFVRGETLEHLAERSGALPADRSAELCQQALVALAHAHRMGVVHRDLKPANLMLTESGTLKIMDFGIARVAGTEHLTNAGYMMGTPAYMAPEQVLGHEVDARADLYALGVVLFRLSTGKLPFKGDTPFAMAQAQVKDPPTPVGLMREGVPAWVDVIVGRALAKSPADRFQTADEFREALQRAAAGLPIEIATTMIVPPELVATMPPRTKAAATEADMLRPPVPPPPPPPAPAPTLATGSAAGPGTVTLKKSNLAAIATGAVVLVLLLVGFVIYRSRSTNTASPAVAESAPAAATPESAPPPVTQEPVPSPPAPAPPPPALPPPATSASSTPATSGPTPSAPRSSSAPATTPPGGGAAGPAAASTGSNPSPSASTGAPLTGPGAGALPPGDDPHVAFVDVKMLVVTDKKSQDQDVTLNLAAGQISLVSKKGGAALKTIPYKRLAHATYIHAHDPKWDPGLSSPPSDLEVPGSFLRSSTRHWLTLQTKTDYLILRLTDDNWMTILQTIESRTGLKVDRLAPPAK